MSIFGNKVTEIGAEALILSLSKYEELECPKAKENKTWYVHCRNRVLSRLKKETKDATMLQNIETIESFFDELGGDKEKEMSKLGWGAKDLVQDTIEKQIVKSIVRSITKKDASEEATRDQILAKARETAPDTVIKRMKALFDQLQDPSTVILT